MQHGLISFRMHELEVLVEGVARRLLDADQIGIGQKDAVANQLLPM